MCSREVSHTLPAMLDMCKPGCSCDFCGVGGGGGLIHPKHGVQHVGSIIINKRAALPVYVCMGK